MVTRGGVIDEPAAVRDRLDRLYSLYADQAVRLAYLLTADRELAQDLAQDAFIRAAGRFGTLRGEAAFGAYLQTTVVNLARSHFRRVRIERRHTPPPIVGTTDAGIAAVEGRDDLKADLLHLPYRQRAALVLRYYEDLSEHDAAHALKCSVPALRSLIHRGLQTLRDAREEKRL